MAYYLPKGVYGMPDANKADKDGLIVFSEELNPKLILLAYARGIFPWFQEQDLYYWYSPNPRCVLYPKDLLVSKSMQKIIRDATFTFEINTDIDAVLAGCANTPRKPTVVKGVVYPNSGTWLNTDFKNVHKQLFEMGFGVHAVAKQNGQIVGGLFGVLIGELFCGESMFARVSNASKFAFIQLVQYLQSLGVQAIDCQMESNHLMSLGASRVPRKKYLALVKKLTRVNRNVENNNS
jgi:leucyl/phenylalanyl-tRNA---protein transferase